MTKKYKNGYSDGSGKGTITLDGKGVLRTHWGCSCCDGGPNDKQIEFADEVVKILNGVKKCKTIQMKK